MKLEMTVSERDKKLLVILAVIVLIVGFVFLGIRPLAANYSEKKAQLEQEQQLQQLNKDKNFLFDKLNETQMRMAADRAAATKDFYGILKSDEIDKMLTNMALGYGLSARDLNIQMPEGELELEPYAYSDAAVSEATGTGDEDSMIKSTYRLQLTEESAPASTDDTADSSADAEEAPEEAPMTGIFAANVSMKLDGKPAAMHEMIDAIAKNYPSIRITGYDWDNGSKVSVSGEDDIVIDSYDVLKLELEIYMCAATAESE